MSTTGRRREHAAGAGNELDLLVCGGGPAGLAAALSALAAGLPSERVLVVEQRPAHRPGDEASHGSRLRVVVLDQTANALLTRLGVAAPGVELAEMVVSLPDGTRRYFPNHGPYEDGVSSAFGGRRLRRMASLGEIERQFLAAYRARGGRIRFGKTAVVSRAASGEATVTVAGRTLSARTIAVAEGAHSPTARAFTSRTSVADAVTPQFNVADAASMSSHLTTGDLASAFDPISGIVAYAFVSATATSCNLLLPEHGLPEVIAGGITAVGYRLGLEDLARRGHSYSGRMTMADCATAGPNLVLLGDALREADAISGAGVNAALIDGHAVGLLAARGGLSDETRPGFVLGAAERTRHAMELSLYFREMVAFLRRRPALGLAAYRMGLTERGATAARNSPMPHKLAHWTAAVLGKDAHDEAIRAGLRLLGGPEPMFQSERRRRLIGTVHGVAF